LATLLFQASIFEKVITFRKNLAYNFITMTEMFTKCVCVREFKDEVIDISRHVNGCPSSQRATQDWTFWTKFLWIES